MDDVTAVIDAAGADQVAVVAHGAGGPMATLFAATYPERVSGLVLNSTFATLARHDDYPAGIPPQIADITLSGDSKRLSANPGVAAAMMRWILRLDVRDVLGAVRVPTLAVQRRDDEFIRREQGVPGGD